MSHGPQSLPYMRYRAAGSCWPVAAEKEKSTGYYWLGQQLLLVQRTKRSYPQHGMALPIGPKQHSAKR
jgi:hypothetical protein